MNLQYGHPSESMTWGGKEMMEGRWRGIAGGQDGRGALDQSYYSELS